MKKIGIIGGLGPESTLEYYAKIIDAFKSKYENDGYPEIIIESVNLKEFLQLASDNQWGLVADKISKIANNLLSCGATFGAIASNTPHFAWKEIIGKTELPLISIVDETAKLLDNQGFKRVLLLGTRFTMSSEFYPEAIRNYNIEVFVPNENDQQYIHKKIFSEIEFGIIKPETKKQFIKIIEKLSDNYKIDAVIMACTELPLILKPQDITQAFIDPTQIHINAIIERYNQE